jgi:hypothetical protein
MADALPLTPSTVAVITAVAVCPNELDSPVTVPVLEMLATSGPDETQDTRRPDTLPPCASITLATYVCEAPMRRDATTGATSTRANAGGFDEGAADSSAPPHAPRVQAADNTAKR